MKTRVISAFPACGKSYMFNNEYYKNKYKMLDSDSSLFSWIYDENGNKTDIKNPDFPQNYIQHIKDNIGKVDFIFVSSHLIVREAMNNEDIFFTTVYPKSNMLNEWVGRMYRRGNDEKFIKFIIDNWDNYMDNIIFEPYGQSLIRLGNNEYIDTVIR